jgi:hypothetical protein
VRLVFPDLSFATTAQVSFENQAEWELVRNFMSGAGVKEIWTAGRLCDSEASDVVFIIVLSPWRLLYPETRHFRLCVEGSERFLLKKQFI